MKTIFLCQFQILPMHRSLSFLLHDWLHGLPQLFLFLFLVYFPTFQLSVPCGSLSWLVSAFEHTIKYYIISYRIVMQICNVNISKRIQNAHQQQQSAETLSYRNVQSKPIKSWQKCYTVPSKYFYGALQNLYGPKVMPHATFKNKSIVIYVTIMSKPPKWFGNRTHRCCLWPAVLDDGECQDWMSRLCKGCQYMYPALSEGYLSTHLMHSPLSRTGSRSVQSFLQDTSVCPTHRSCYSLCVRCSQ